MMHSYRIVLKPESAFATPLVGDTLFGQLCWALRFRFGEDRLEECLKGYTNNAPFVIVSDAMPSGFLPMPCLPVSWLTTDSLDTKVRKQLKKRRWIPTSAIKYNAERWLEQMLALSSDSANQRTEHQPRNSINRLLNTTDGGEFAPYSEERDWYTEDTELELIMALDETRLSLNECRMVLADIGLTGYGKNATIGSGKFSVLDISPMPKLDHATPNAYLTLAPCAPQGDKWQTAHCFYHTQVRFGRHGAQAVHMDNPFKAPVVFAATGAVLSPQTFSDALFIGKGLGGNGQLSKSLPSTVTQGYAPVVGIRIPLPQHRVA